MKTGDGKKARIVLLEIRPSIAMTKSIEERSVAMLESNIARLSAEIVIDQENKGFLKGSETGTYCVKLRKFNAEQRIIEKIKQLNFEIISRLLA